MTFNDYRYLYILQSRGKQRDMSYYIYYVVYPYRIDVSYGNSVHLYETVYRYFFLKTAIYSSPLTA